MLSLNALYRLFTLATRYTLSKSLSISFLETFVTRTLMHATFVIFLIFLSPGRLKQIFPGLAFALNISNGDNCLDWRKFFGLFPEFSIPQSLKCLIISFKVNYEKLKSHTGFSITFAEMWETRAIIIAQNRRISNVCSNVLHPCIISALYNRSISKSAVKGVDRLGIFARNATRENLWRPKRDRYARFVENGSRYCYVCFCGARSFQRSAKNSIPGRSVERNRSADGNDEVGQVASRNSRIPCAFSAPDGKSLSLSASS